MRKKDGEQRIDYLLRVLNQYMDCFGDGQILYDEAECDGVCLAEDICNEVEIVSTTINER